MSTFAERWIEAVEAGNTDAEPDERVLVEIEKPTWRGDPLRFDTWVEEDPGGMLIVVTAVLNAPDERRAKWREN
jgi:hypothetical protein